jgi:hypothetical protein
MSRIALLIVSALVAAAGSASAASKAAAPIDFNREIRPILSENCFTCHGPDENKRKAKLRLDVKEDALKPAKSGDYAIVPGDPAKSELIKRLDAKDPDDIMPPAKTNKKLTQQQKELLKRWIREGAPWQEHWAFVVPKRPGVPTAGKGTGNKKDGVSSTTNPIDAFARARLEKEKLKPSPEADKTTLIRRATLDTTGLPPTPQEVDAFLADSSPEAYEKLVDRLLASPRYGEHQAKAWLDAARYADSHGYHIDSERSIWKYREWVIDAFNKNQPFDQFTIEQLAGDLLPEATTEQKVASGYVRCNLSTGEGGAIEDEYRAKYAFDRVETSGTIWMGLTLVCARCHTHKYDPIPQREYYGMYSFFNNLAEPIMDGNKANPEPIMRLPTAEQSRRQEELKKWLAEGQVKLDAKMPGLDAKQPEWEAKWRKKLSEGWVALKPASVSSTNKGVAFKTLDDNSVLVSGENPPKDVHEVTLPVKEGTLAGLRLEALPDSSLPNKSSARSDDGAFRLSEFEAEISYPGTNKTAKPQKLKFTQAIADSANGASDAAKAIDAKADTGWQADAVTEPHAALFLPAEPLALKPDATLRVLLRYESSQSKRAIGRFRISAAQDPGLVALLAPPKPEPWQVIGPFKTDGTAEGFAHVYEPEKAVDLKAKFPGVRDEIKWNAKPDFADGKENLLVQDLHGVHGAYYLYRTIKMSEPRKVQLSLDADDLFKLWVNGKLVAERSMKAKVSDPPMKVTAEFKQGENKLLYKIVTTQGAAYFSFASDLEGADSLPADLAALFAATKNFNADQQKKVRTLYRKLHSPEFKETFDNVDQWKKENDGIEKAIPTTMIAKESDKHRDTMMLIRGEYDKKGEKVPAAVPSILGALPPGAPTNRLGFAQWLASTNHPLTARVTVNRFWQHFFGTGLVKTSDDFGVQGDRPSHPELLDWLACEFMSSGWNVKHIQRLILTSATYRQSSKFTSDLLARDPENRLLARGPRFRVDAEVVRDTALFVSGLMVEQRGGKSVKPYEPPGLWEAVSFNNSQKYVPDKGEAQYRRSLYTYWKRQSPPPAMLIFDAPTREYCVVRRPRTNTPLQALALMNDPQIVEASRAFAQRILLDGGVTDEDRAAYAFRVATSRKPTKDEAKVLLEVLKQQRAAFAKDAGAAEKLLNVGAFKAQGGMTPTELAAWTTVASLILNLDETITKS